MINQLNDNEISFVSGGDAGTVVTSIWDWWRRRPRPPREPNTSPIDLI